MRKGGEPGQWRGDMGTQGLGLGLSEAKSQPRFEQLQCARPLGHTQSVRGGPSVTSKKATETEAHV